MSEHQSVTRELFDQVMVPNYAPGTVIPVKGQGSHVWDQQGNKYIDFAGGIAVSALGHAHPKLVSALTQQAQKLWHLSNVLTNEPALELAKKLTDITFADKVFFANSGGEANEAAFKLARRYAWEHQGPEKNEIIAFKNAFHGRTLFTVSVGGQPKYTEGFAPIPGGIRHASFNDIESLQESISECTCAVVVEPIQGEGGVVPADPEFLRQVRKLCDENDALLIFDEIQTGVGRTGSLYAYMEYGVVPDIMTTAKALGGGFPIAAMLTTDDIAKSLSIGTHGSTYGGNPLGCAVSLALIDEVLSGDMLSNVKAKGELIRAGIERLNVSYPIFETVRGAGLLIGAELKGAYSGKAKMLMQDAMDEGLMALVAGPNVLRIAPSLLINEKEIEAGLELLGKAMAKFVRE